MDITPAAVRALRTTFNRDFRDAYMETEVFYPRVSTTITSSSSQNDYGWMAKLEGMREWIGSRVVDNLVTHNYSIVNKTWEKTVGVLRDDIEDDNLGIYSPMFEEIGELARKHPDELMTSLLQNGHARLCFDGQYYFDTDHPEALKGEGSATYSNYESTGRALSEDNFFVVRANMMGFKGDGGRPLKIVPDLLIVPPALEKTALSITQAERGASGATNIAFRLSDFIVIPELAGQDTTWYMAATQRRIRGLIFQTRRSLHFQAKNKVDDEVVLEENEVRFYADARYNVGYSLPFLMYKAVA